MANDKASGRPFWYYVRNYLTVYLPKIRYLSPRTIDTYRQSIAMFCTFLKEVNGVKFSGIAFDHATRDSVIRFIQWLQHRQCRPATCNLRLSSLKSFLKYCSDEDVSLYSVYQEIQRIPMMKDPKTPVQYLSETALKTLLAQPDSRSTKGRRNSMLIVFLYDTGVRVRELVELKVSDLHLQARNPFVIVTGKGSKTRSVPLMDETVSHLKEYLRRFHNNSIESNDDPLFFSVRYGTAHMLSTDAVAAMLKKYGNQARQVSAEVPSRVHPHLIRHTRAMHLYRSGIPLSYIAEFLGHASMNTTEIYASASVDMLHAALKKANPQMIDEIPEWKDEESLKALCGL
jgi:integrase/recombinase XerD